MSLSFATSRRNMVDCQIKPFSVNDERVLAAFAAVPREEFVPPALKDHAYTGEDLPLGHGRFLLDASAYARLLQEASIDPKARVLDIGCLYGYSSAILSHLAAQVVALDAAPMIEAAKKNAFENVTFVAGDMTKGVSQSGPYDVIIINGAVQQVPSTLIEQLHDGGVIATFTRNRLGKELASGQAVVYHKTGKVLRAITVFDAMVPMLPGFEKAEGFVF